jgi:3-oxoacyl-[acyl-carrier protein] reductase
VDVRGKTILVTGAGRGIGRSLSEHFARKGAKLALLDTNAEDLEETRARCAQLGAVARSYVANAADEDSVVGALDQITSDFGGLDGLINNAGIVHDALLVKVKDGQVVGKMTLAQWQSVIDVNLTGVFLCAREAAQRMISRATGGVIVNISSICRAGNAGQTNYSAAKAGIIGATKALALELAKRQITVNCVAPGFVSTDMLQAHPSLEEVIKNVPMQRAGTVEEVAALVSFLISPDASYITRQVIDVNGGLY